jgi:hypothetical protein
MDYEEMLRRLMSGQYANEAIVPQPLPDDYGSTIGVRAMQDLLAQSRQTPVAPRDSLGATAQDRLDLGRAKVGAQYGGAPGLGFGENVADRYAAARAPINVPPQQNLDAQWALRSRRYPTMPGDAGPGAAPAGPRTLADIRARAEQLKAGRKYLVDADGAVRGRDVPFTPVADAEKRARNRELIQRQRSMKETIETRRSEQAITNARRQLLAKDPAVALNAAARLRRAGLLDEGDTFTVMQERVQQLVRAGLSPQAAGEIVAGHMEQASREKYRKDALGLEEKKLATAKETAAEERRNRNLEAAEERKRLREEAAAKREESALLRALEEKKLAAEAETRRYVADKGLEGTLSKDPLDTPSGRSAFAIRSNLNPNDPKTQ